MYRKVFIYLLCFVLLFTGTAYASQEPEISAKAAVVIDAATGTVFYSRNQDEHLAVASTTKIMTALIACESGRLSYNVTVTAEMLDGCEGTLIGLNAGDSITLYDLTKGALLASGNDAANAIAFYLSGSTEEFASVMNNRAKSLGMYNTFYVTPSGLDEGGNYSSAYDLAVLTGCAMRNKTFRELVIRKSDTVTINSDSRVIYNHNRLLSRSKHFIGVKTGFTERAGRCLVSAYRYKGNIIITVTLSDPDDWTDHVRLVKFAKKKYKYFSDIIKITLPAADNNDKAVNCSFGYSVYAPETVTVKLYYYPFVYTPCSKGDTAGVAEIYSGDKLLDTIDITVEE